MKKRIICIFVIATILFSLTGNALAHGKEKHDPIIERVLFGDESFKKAFPKNDERYKKKEDLEYAVALAIDQYNYNSESYLQYLQSRGIHGLPKTIEKMNYSGSVNEHRRHTHLGWNFPYLGENLDKWNIRKDILLQTTNSVFGFKRAAGKWVGILDFKYDEQCEAFAALLYYIHILGDYVGTKEARDLVGKVIPLVRNSPGKENEDIVYELQEWILPIVLKNSVISNKTLYDSLMRDLKTISKEGRDLGGENHITENYTEYCDLASVLLSKLESKLPTLLKDEPFFRDVFYS